MLVRCAYYAGTVDPKDQKKFDNYVLNVHLPMVAKWPRLRRLRLLKNNGNAYEGEAPRYYQCFELGFDNQADMDFCMASEDRRICRQISAKDIDSFKGLFRGEVHHINYEVTEIRILSSEKSDAPRT